jgi:hypothetical protein
MSILKINPNLIDPLLASNGAVLVYNSANGVVEFGTSSNSSDGNTNITVGSTLVSNSSIIIEGGEGISVTGNSIAHTVTITPIMSNATSQVIEIDGSANSFVTTISVANTTMVLVSYNGLLQDPTRYASNATHLILNNAAPLTAGSNLEIRYFNFFAFQG